MTLQIIECCNQAIAITQLHGSPAITNNAAAWQPS